MDNRQGRIRVDRVADTGKAGQADGRIDHVCRRPASTAKRDDRNAAGGVDPVEARLNQKKSG